MKRNILIYLAVLILSQVLAFSEAFAGAESSYRLGVGDMIKITVLHEESLTLETSIAENGSISYPVLGEVQVEGKTTREVESIIKTALASGFLVNPHVSVNVVVFRSFYIGGEVKSPGAYPYQPGLTIEKAISVAGGRTDKASDRFVVIRESDVARTAIPATSHSPVSPGDEITIENAGEIMVVGEVRQPGVYPYKSGLTIEKAISIAGGRTEKASEVAVVKREGVSTRIAENELTHSTVRPDDQIIVQNAGEIMVGGEVRQPGVYPYVRGLTVLKAVTLAGGPTERASKTIVVIHEQDPNHEPVEVGLFDSVLPGDIITVEESFF
jgi:polysaccharide export outer membrane protein